MKSQETPPLPTLKYLEDKLSGYPDLLFAVGFAMKAGQYMRAERDRAIYRLKPDGTRVTDVEQDINDVFLTEANELTNSLGDIIGEEGSSRVINGRVSWLIDPIDGTRQYTDSNTKKLNEKSRHSSIGIAKIDSGVLTTAVVMNPFRGELYYSDRKLGGAYLNSSHLELARLGLDQAEFNPDMRYNYTFYKGASFDRKRIRNLMENKPSGHIGSTLYQACMVARGLLAFSVFPGRSAHDIAPGALMVELSGGQVSDIEGAPLDWKRPNGAIYAVSRSVHETVVGSLR